MGRLMDRFTLADNWEQLNRVDQLFNESFTKDRRAKSEKFAEMRNIMKFTDFVGFAETNKAVTLWRSISRRKLVARDRGVVVGSKVRSVGVPKGGRGVVFEIRDDFVLKIRYEDGSTAAVSPHDVVPA